MAVLIGFQLSTFPFPLDGAGASALLRLAGSARARAREVSSRPAALGCSRTRADARKLVARNSNGKRLSSGCVENVVMVEPGRELASSSSSSSGSGRSHAATV